MSEKTKEVPQLADTTYAHNCVDVVDRFYSFTMQTLSIHCILKFFDLFGFLRHYLLKSRSTFHAPASCQEFFFSNLLILRRM